MYRRHNYRGTNNEHGQLGTGDRKVLFTEDSGNIGS